MSLDNLIEQEYVAWKPGLLGIGKSRIVVPKSYEQKSNIGRVGRSIGSAIGGLATVALLTACPVNGGNGKPPVCDTNPAVVLAEEYGLPQSIVDAVAPLGDDCVVDSNERNLITNLLPSILQRSNEKITLSYPERFVGDDGKFEEAENIVMSRFLTGRYDREGLLVHPGYFELVDKGHVQIPNAWFMPIFEMPFRFDPFPAGDSGGKGMPIVSDNTYVSHYNVFDVGRAVLGDSFFPAYSWFELYSDNINPSPNICVTDFNYASMQIVFANNRQTFSIDKLEIVNPLPVPATITEIGFLVNANDVRNARIRLEPTYWPSSLGHPGLQVSMSHVDDEDIETGGLRVGDIINPEERITRVDPDFNEWRLIFSYRSDKGFYRPGDADKDSRFKVIDIFHPHFYEPEMRGRVWPVYFENVNTEGVPVRELLGVHNSVCNFVIGDAIYWGRDASVLPMKLRYPADTLK